VDIVGFVPPLERGGGHDVHNPMVGVSARKIKRRPIFAAKLPWEIHIRTAPVPDSTAMLVLSISDPVGWCNSPHPCHLTGASTRKGRVERGLFSCSTAIWTTKNPAKAGFSWSRDGDVISAAWIRLARWRRRSLRWLRSHRPFSR
jgi:hypothetical protein